MRHLFFALVAVLAASPAFAQRTSVPLTLEEAIRRAMDVSHRLGEARAREQGAQAEIEIRRAALPIGRRSA
jgi:hypothetical protein